MEGTNESREERRASIALTEEQLEAIAERAANKVFEKFQLEVGKVTLRGLGYACGLVLTGVLAYLISKGYIKVG